jgi:hexokinase
MVGASNRQPPSAQGNLISEYLPNVRSKQSHKKHHGPISSSSPSRATNTATTSSLNDLTSAISALELTTNPSLPTSSHPRKCTCNASIHPLFLAAPNCLSCGKIVCALEGLQPCSFCGTPLLSPEETQSMLSSLKQERGTERQSLHNKSIAASRNATPNISPSLSSSNTPTSSAENLRALSAAKAHRDKLLAYQSQNSQRTKIHDEAADFSVLNPGATQWITPVQRAAALKQQQKYLRELEENSRPEYEKTRQVVSLGFNKQGKLVRTYQREKVPSAVGDVDVGDGEEVELEELEQKEGGGVLASGSGAFSNNPLLKGGGLIRPIWKPKGGESGKKGKGRSDERMSVWRRVQDDEDNEQWVL